jgi:hypothetical protein
MTPYEWKSFDNSVTIYQFDCGKIWVMHFKEKVLVTGEEFYNLDEAMEYASVPVVETAWITGDNTRITKSGSMYELLVTVPFKQILFYDKESALEASESIEKVLEQAGW